MTELRTRMLGVAVLVAAVSGCSGEERPEPSVVPTYYTELESLTHRLDRDNTAADEALGAELEEAAPREVGDIFSKVTLEGADRLAGVVEEMAALTPPEDAAAAHTELVDATSAMVAEDRVTGAALAGLDQDQLASLDPRPAYLAAEERVDAACAAVQAIADDAGADVGLCVGMFAPPG